jgi:excisionase family DNA binding protein
MPEKLYKADEAQAILGCGATTFYAMVRTGRLRAAKCGRAWRIPESAFSEWLHGGGGGEEQSKPDLPKAA